MKRLEKERSDRGDKKGYTGGSRCICLFLCFTSFLKCPSVRLILLLICLVSVYLCKNSCRRVPLLCVYKLFLLPVIPELFLACFLLVFFRPPCMFALIGGRCLRLTLSPPMVCDSQSFAPYRSLTFPYLHTWAKDKTSPADIAKPGAKTFISTFLLPHKHIHVYLLPSPLSLSTSLPRYRVFSSHFLNFPIQRFDSHPLIPRRPFDIK